MTEQQNRAGPPAGSSLGSLQGVPTSLQSGIDHALQLLNQSQLASTEGDFELARVRAVQGLKVVKALATSMPQLAAVLMAASAGFRQIEEEVVVRKDRYYPEDVKFFGITVAKTMQHSYTIETHIRTQRIK